MKYVTPILLLFALLFRYPAHAQPDNTDAQQLITRLLTNNELRVAQPQQVRLLYNVLQYQPAWFGKNQCWRPLLQYLQQGPALGLGDSLYKAAGTRAAADTPLVTLRDTVAADILLTDAAICFFEQVLYGSQPPALDYNGLHYTPDCVAVPLLLAAALEAGQFEGFMQQYENPTPPYKALKATLAQLLLQQRDSSTAQQIQQLGQALNTLRWLHCLLRQHPLTIVVNIPAASLLLFKADSIAMQSRVITGKKSTPTPLFTSCLSEVVLFPYWTVPHTIATRELLPMIKKDVHFLTANQFVLLDKNGKTVAPETVNWQKITAASFTYTLRQSTGCDNALGLVKLNFYTPYGVYLHDTPWKVLYNLNKRYMSHGCVRVENILPIAYQVLPGKAAEMKAILAQGQKRHPQPVVFTVPQTVPVIVLYNTAWFDADLQVRFYADPYRKTTGL